MLCITVCSASRSALDKTTAPLTSNNKVCLIKLTHAVPWLKADEMLKMGFAEDIEKILAGVAQEDPKVWHRRTLRCGTGGP